MPVAAPTPPTPGADRRWARSAPVLLVDRDDELELLAKAVGDLRRGRRPGLGMVTLAGRHGVGRSAIIDALVDGATAVGLRVAIARCTPSESDLPFGVVHQLATGLVPPGAALWTLTGGGEPAVAALCAEFLAAARTHPLVIAVDDAQWADALSRSWLTAMGRRAGQAPLLLVQSTTATGTHPEPAAARVLRLRPLRERAVREVIGHHYEGPVDGGFVSAATAATGGRPAVLGAVLSHFADAALSPVAEHAPIAEDRAAAALDDRAAAVLAALPPAATDLLRALLLCGEQLGPELAASLVETHHTAPLFALLAHADLIAAPEDPRPAGPRVRAAALAGMPAARKQDLLRRAVELGRRAAIPDDQLAALLVAAPPVGAEWPVALLARVAARRRHLGDHVAATAMLARALREPVSRAKRVRLLVELASIEVVTNPHAADRRLRQAVLDADPGSGPAVSAADLLQVRGDAATARRVIATACARGTGDAALAAIGWLAENDCVPHPAPLFPHPDAGLAPQPSDVARSGVAAWALTLRGGHLAQARALARAALAETAPGPRPFGPRVHACRALLHADEITDAVLGLDAVIAEAGRRGIPAAGAAALVQRAWCEHRRGNVAQAREDLAAATARLPVSAWHPRAVPLLAALSGLLSLAGGELDEAERAVTAPQPAGADQGAAWGLLLSARGEIALAGGDPATALRWAEACGRVLTARGWLNPALSPWRSLAAVGLAARGEPDAADVLTAEALNRAARWGAPSALAQAAHWASHATEAGELSGAGHVLSTADQRIAVLAATGRTAAEISGLLGVPPATVRRRLAAIRGAVDRER
ncbi:AAA family ATPase [Actinokineospora guangxiensis]|uniref:AAA family ATPase n=1 Tax=Actinokineospora guangxiensis TaxID=1490288 RepID=A0ABW0EWC9_9PSEU